MSDQQKLPDSTQEDILLEHNYDGIQEFDNPLPGWWKAIFLGSILFAIPYTWWYHFADGNTVYDHYEADVAAQLAREAARPQADTSAEGLFALMQDPAHLARGKAKFATVGCTACHAPDGGGVIGLGPNFCDDFGKNIQSMEDIVRVITHGVPGTAMLSQSATMNENEIADVAVFVASLRGTTPANPKAAEGEKMPAWGSQ
ncbi:MAG: cbb3-type cytochrome c oxidase N-terminal domain-containing protein [Planctomycetota bacterium]